MCWAEDKDSIVGDVKRGLLGWDGAARWGPLSMFFIPSSLPGDIHVLEGGADWL